MVQCDSAGQSAASSLNVKGVKATVRSHLAMASLAVWLLLPVGLAAQCPSAPQGEIVANPNRPTVADPADITQLGVLELEYGWQRDWFAGAQRGTSLGGLLKFAASCNLEIRWSPEMLVTQGKQRGFGGNWIGTQYRFHYHTGRVPSLAVSYAVKIPSASTARGLGSGRTDQQFKFLAGKDVLGTHFDFNASALLLGRALGHGFDHKAEIDLSFSHRLAAKLGLTGEVYGDTRLNSIERGFVSTLWGSPTRSPRA
jgi:hypothetical protein